MNTSCKRLLEVEGDNDPMTCQEPTKFGRTHCHEHRAEELKRLSQAKVRAREAYEAAEKAFDVYFREGSGL
jgi:hypothetical protein